MSAAQLRPGNAGLMGMICLLAILLMLSACSEDGSADGGGASFEASPVEGIWASAAFGRVYAFTRSGNTYVSQLYHLTENACLPGVSATDLSAEDLEAVTRLTDDPEQIEIHQPGESIAPGVVYTRHETLPGGCDDPLPVKGEADYTFDASRDLQLFWDSFNERYLDFTLSDTDWQDIYTQALNELPDISGEDDLFDLFSRMIEPLEDGHNILVHGDLSQGVRALLDSDADFEEFSVSGKPDFVDRIEEEYATLQGLSLPLGEADEPGFETYLDAQEQKTEEAILSYARTPQASAADENFIWFMLESNVAYLHIGRMAGYGDREFDGNIPIDVAMADDAMMQALTDLEGASGLVVDLRHNEGGNDEVSLSIAQRFIANSDVVYSQQARLGNERTELVDVRLDPATGVQFLGPIVLLTSTTTASAAETFALALRDFPNVTIVGEPSAGRFSSTLDSRVTSDIAFGLSNEYYFSPAGEWFERVGIPVDLDVPFSTLEQREQLRDYGIEAALELLSQ